MNAVVVVCDRCKEQVRGIQIEGVCTSGFYFVESGIWHKYAQAGEVYLCDACMWEDPRYLEDYKQGIINKL